MNTTDKDFVAITETQCPLCGKREDRGVVLHKRLSKVLPHRVFDGYELCDEHKAQTEGGAWVFLIALTRRPGDDVGGEPAQFTGDVVRIKRDAAARIFNVPLSPEGFQFCEVGVVDVLRRAVEAASSTTAAPAPQQQGEQP